MARREFLGNVVETTTTGALSSTDTSISLTNGSTFPTGSVAPFVIVLDRGTSLEEKVLVTSRSSNTLTVSQRGYDGTTAVSHSSGAFVDHVLDATTIDEVNSYVNLQSAKGDLVVHNGTNPVVKTVGTDGYVLSANSAQADGLEWIQVGVQAGSVGTTELAADAVTNAIIADDAVDTEHIADASLGRKAMFPVASLTYAGGTVSNVVSAPDYGIKNVTITKVSDPDSICSLGTPAQNGGTKIVLNTDSIYIIKVSQTTFTSTGTQTVIESYARVYREQQYLGNAQVGIDGVTDFEYASGSNNESGAFAIISTSGSSPYIVLQVNNIGAYYSEYDSLNYSGGTIALYKLFG